MITCLNTRDLGRFESIMQIRDVHKLFSQPTGTPQVFRFGNRDGTVVGAGAPLLTVRDRGPGAIFVLGLRLVLALFQGFFSWFSGFLPFTTRKKLLWLPIVIDLIIYLFIYLFI